MKLEKTVVLGTEYDDELRDALRDVLIEMGGNVQGSEWTMGGSQELDSAAVRFGEELIIVESETYVGLSITGPEDLVNRIEQKLHK